MSATGGDWLDEQARQAQEDFLRIVRAYAAIDEPFPAAAAVWRDFTAAHLTALAALSPEGPRFSFAADWLSLNGPARARAFAAMRAAVSLGALCADALELESALRKVTR